MKEEVRRDRPAGHAGKEVHSVRLGAGDRSYLVRDKQIEVLKNVYGGVQVRNDSVPTCCTVAWIPLCICCCTSNCTAVVLLKWSA